MPRAKGGSKTRQRRKKVLKRAEGFVGRKKTIYTRATEMVTRALRYAFRDRKAKKRDFRALWVQRINAAVREMDLPYNKFVAGLKKNSIALDRKILADLAVKDSKAFAKIVELAKA